MNSIAALFFLLAGGMFLVLFRVPYRKIGASYHRLVTYICLVGWVLALVNTRPGSPGGWIQFSLLILMAVGGLLHVFSLHTGRESLRAGIYVGVWILVLFGFGSLGAWPPGRESIQYYSSAPTLFLQFTLSGLILGSIVDAMICGHWYLVNTGLSLEPIRAISRTLWAALAAKGLVLCVILYLLHVASPPLFREIVVGMGSLFWVRVIASIPFGGLLNWMSWKALEVDNTQAATGILYATIVFIIIGEFFAYFLTLVTGVAL